MFPNFYANYLLLYKEFRHIRAKTHYIVWYSNNHIIDILIMQLAMIVSIQCHSHSRWIKINFKLNWVSAWYIRYDLFRSFPFQTYKVSPFRLSSWYHFKQGNSYRFSILTPAIVPMRMCILLKIDKNCRPAYRMVSWTWVFRDCWLHRELWWQHRWWRQRVIAKVLISIALGLDTTLATRHNMPYGKLGYFHHKWNY